MSSIDYEDYMRDQILLYREMCDGEKKQTLQRGMNYRLNNQYSVILMSQRSNAPYNDRIHEDGVTIEYEGHDVPKSKAVPDPKSIDQEAKTATGTLTQNGYFIEAVERYKANKQPPEPIRVYEKILPGIWSDKGFFKIIDFKRIRSGSRFVYRFVMQATEFETQDDHLLENTLSPRSRVIPTEIKKIVWERDGGKCVICGSTDELHFDHDVPYSKGGSSITAANVRILCARHNLSKSDKIE